MPPFRRRGGGAKAAAAASGVVHVWNIGDLVLAKVKGHPWWPARVTNNSQKLGHSSQELTN